ARARELLRSRRSGSGAARPAILLIDDSTTYRETLRQMLESAGYEVRTAASGEEGLRAAASARPAAIVVDSVLPGVDGTTVIRRVRLDAALRGVPCVLLTGSEDREAELRALDAGADTFVRKEEDDEVILARLAAALRSAAQSAPEDTASLLGPKKILAVDDRAAMLDGLGAGADDYIQKSGEFEVLKARVRAQIRRKQFEDENRRIREELLHERLEATQARAARNLAETRALLVEELERK